MWTNIGLRRFKHASVDSFTSDTGITIRRLVNPVFRVCLLAAKRGRIHVNRLTTLDKNTPYIYVSTHSCISDPIANIASIDRNVYILVGTTDQIDHNPKMYAQWINGMVFVDRLDQESRRSSTEKLGRILKNGTSVLLFPEGGLNNSENLLVQPLFSGPWLLAKKTGIEVVPVAVRQEYKEKNIWVEIGAPMRLDNLEKGEALRILRDAMATLSFHLMESHGSRLVRSEIDVDCRSSYMTERMREYLQVKWTHDVWDEEITVYKRKDATSPQEVRAGFKNVMLTTQNAHIVSRFLREIKIDEKYDFKRFMHEHWQS